MSNIRSKIDYDNNVKQNREIRRQQLLQSRRDLTNQNCFGRFEGVEAEKVELFQTICMIFEIVDRFFSSADFKYGFINYIMLMCNNVDFITSKSFGPNPNFQILDDLDILLNVNDYQKCFDDETIYELPKNSVSFQFVEQYLNHRQYQSTLKNIVEALTVMLMEIYLIAFRGYNIDLEHLKTLTYQIIRIC